MHTCMALPFLHAPIVKGLCLTCQQKACPLCCVNSEERDVSNYCSSSRLLSFLDRLYAVLCCAARCALHMCMQAKEMMRDLQKLLQLSCENARRLCGNAEVRRMHACMHARAQLCQTGCAARRGLTNSPCCGWLNCMAVWAVHTCMRQLPLSSNTCFLSSISNLGSSRPLQAASHHLHLAGQPYSASSA